MPREVICFLGLADHVAFLRSELGVDVGELREGGRSEEFFTLDLYRMLLPNGAKSVRRALPCDAEVLIGWRHDFYVESLDDTPGQKTYEKAQNEISRRISEGDLFVLEQDGDLVSFCGVGGFLPDWKVVGPVWTPVAQRGCGFARIVTAGALAIVRDEEATNAVLFTNNPQAERAYRALGFERVADWSLDFLITPQLRQDTAFNPAQILVRRDIGKSVDAE